MLIVLVLVVLGCAYWAYWASYFRRMEKATASVPTVPGLPLLGNATIFVGSTQKILRKLKQFSELAFAHKGVVKMWLGPKLYALIVNPEDVQVILEKCLDKDDAYRFLRPWMGNGLFVAPLEIWKSQRKVMKPIFKNKVVEEYLEVIGEQADVLVEQLGTQTDKGDFDVLQFITACTLDIIFETTMGERMDVQHCPNTPYLRARNNLLSILNMRFFKAWLQPDCLFKLTSYAKEHDECIKLTHEFTNEVVKKMRVEYEKSKQNNDTVTNGNDRGKLKVVLDLLFGREIEFTDEQLRELVDSITIAGNDTTALTISYTLMLLGQHKDAQDKVVLELKTIFGDSKRAATKHDIAQMVYLERVLKESMRLYTVAPIIARNIHKDTYLPHSDVTLPAGMGCVVGSFAMHRATSLWGADADVFDPDRFLPERSVDRHRCTYLPFSYATRDCIGRNFGLLIIKSMLSTILRSYKIYADEVGPLQMELLLLPVRGHQIRISRREEQEAMGF